MRGAPFTNPQTTITADHTEPHENHKTAIPVVGRTSLWYHYTNQGLPAGKC